MLSTPYCLLLKYFCLTYFSINFKYHISTVVLIEILNTSCHKTIFNLINAYKCYLN